MKSWSGLFRCRCFYDRITSGLRTRPLRPRDARPPPPRPLTAGRRRGLARACPQFWVVGRIDDHPLRRPLFRPTGRCPSISEGGGDPTTNRSVFQTGSNSAAQAIHAGHSRLTIQLTQTDWAFRIEVHTTRSAHKNQMLSVTGIPDLSDIGPSTVFRSYIVHL